jgi:hypothetical protein
MLSYTGCEVETTHGRWPKTSFQLGVRVFSPLQHNWSCGSALGDSFGTAAAATPTEASVHLRRASTGRSPRTKAGDGLTSVVGHPAAGSCAIAFRQFAADRAEQGDTCYDVDLATETFL